MSTGPRLTCDDTAHGWQLAFLFGVLVWLVSKKIVLGGGIAHVVCELFCFSILCHMVACRPNCVLMKFGLRLGLLF